MHLLHKVDISSSKFEKSYFSLVFKLLNILENILGLISSVFSHFLQMAKAGLCFPLLSHFTIRNVFYHLMCVFGTVFSNMLL